MLFTSGARDEFCHWLIDGEVDVISTDHKVEQLKSGSVLARSAIDNNDPHTRTAVTTQPSLFFRMPRTVVDFVTQLADNNNYMVSPIRETHEAEADWMSGLLSSPVFELIPPKNIARLFSEFEEIEAQQGDRVIEEGEVGQYFYVLRKGNARVEQEQGDSTRILAHFGPGASFGEDALISKVPRNATVTMTSAGVLMRLSQQAFDELLQTPILSSISTDDLNTLRDSTGQSVAVLDVRNPEEECLEDVTADLHIPLLQLRDHTEALSRDTTYVTVCNEHKRAELAAYILNAKGIGAYVLNDAHEMPVNS
jgi:CRP-like cAMP-binding protein